MCNASGGHTQVFNKRLLVEAIRVDFPPAILHDWWIYSVCQVLGGDFVCETPPLLYYRQHTNNVVGSRNRKKPLLRKVGEIMKSTGVGLSYSLAVSLYDGYKDLLDEERRRILRLVTGYKDSIWGKSGYYSPSSLSCPATRGQISVFSYLFCVEIFNICTKIIK